MNNQIQLVLKSSTTELSLNDRELGIYLTPELDGLTGLPEIRTTSGVNAGYDGGWTSAQNYDARSITIRGVIANEDVATVEQLRRQLTTLAGQGKNEELTLDLVTQAGKAYTIQVRTIALEMSLQKVLTQQEFMLQLRADDPLIYDASETGHEALLQVAQATGGFTIDFELPLAITGSSEETVVNNEGLEQVPTVTRMYGELHNPKIINQTTNQFMQIEADLGFAEGDWIEPSEVVSGKDITINGAPEGAPFSQFDLKGNTTQQTYTGKNLCGIPDQTFTHLGVVVTIKDGEITMNGTSTGTGTRNISPIKTTTLNGSYTTSLIYVSGTAGSGNFNLRKASDNTVVQGTQTTFASSNSSVSYNISNTEVIFGLYILSVGAVFTNYKFKVQIVAGSTADYNFEPYTNGPAPNPDYPQAVQTVTGENVISITGKNLFDYTTYRQSGQGLTNTLNADGTITTTGIPTGNFARIVPNLTITDLLEDGATYTLSKTISGNLVAAQVQAAKVSGGNDYYIGTFTVNKSTHTSYLITAQTTTMEGWGSESRTITCGYQLEKGSSASSFEPYQGQSYEVNLGKNLCSSAWETGAYSSSTGEKTSGSTSTRTADYIPVERNSTYIASVDGSGLAMNIYSYDINKNFLGHQLASNGSSFTTGLNTRFITMARSANVDVTKMQLEKGSSITSYAAYFAPIELCKIGDYQDSIYKSGGKWYVRKEVGKITLDGSLDESIVSGGTATSGKVRFNITVSGVADIGGSEVASYSDNFVGITRNDTWNCVQGVALGQNLIQIYCEATSGYNLDQFRTWLGSHNTTVYYALATPTDTEITNETLLAQLEALAAAIMYNPQTNITTLYADGNEQPTLDVSYFTDKNPDTRDELVIDSRLRTITLNGLDVYHLQAPGSEFLMLAPGENRLSLQSDITGDNGYAQVSYKQGYLSI